MSVVVEGVETADQATVLKSTGFDLAQGYLFGRPASAADLADLSAVRHHSRVVAGHDASVAAADAEPHATVVVVDDDLVSRNLTTYLLSVVPALRVLAAADGEEFNAICDREQPDLVLMDLRLPDSSGGELARIFHHQGSPNVPVVAVTAYAEQLRNGDEPGIAEFVDVISKPISADTFVKQIEGYLPRAR